MSFQKCPICDGAGIYPGPGTFDTIPTCPTCEGQRIISTISGRPPKIDNVYIYSPLYTAPNQTVIEPAIWPDQSYSNSKTTQDVSNIPSPGSQLQEPRPE